MLVVERFDGRREGDGAAALVVLDAVVEQVDEYLSNMGGAADHVLVDSVGLAGVEHCYAAVRCTELAQYERVVAQFFKIERFVIERYFAILDPAHLEDVVDQRQQVIGGNTRLGAAFAGDLHVAFSQFLNFDKAQDAVERRADVVAHAREKSGFGGVGGVGFLPCFLCALKRPDKDGDAGEQHADDNGRNGGAVAVDKLERVRFLRRVRCGGIAARRERFACIDDALIDDSQQLGFAARNYTR